MNNYEYLKGIKEQFGPLMQSIEKSGILQERERIEEMRRMVEPAVKQFQVSGLDATTMQTIKSLDLQGVKALAEQYEIRREEFPHSALKAKVKPKVKRRKRNIAKAAKITAGVVTSGGFIDFLCDVAPQIDDEYRLYWWVLIILLTAAKEARESKHTATE